MRRSVREQLQIGLRLGGGLGVFLIGALLLGQAHGRIEALSMSNQTGWSDWLVWLEVLLGIGLLFSTVHVWYQWLAGCLLFCIVKGLIALITGTAVFPVRQLPPTRIASLMVVLYCAATLLLLIQFREKRLTITDRTTVTLYVLSFLPQRSSFPSVYEIVGLAGLLLTWAFHRWRAPVSASGRIPNAS